MLPTQVLGRLSTGQGLHSWHARDEHLQLRPSLTSDRGSLANSSNMCLCQAGSLFQRSWKAGDAGEPFARVVRHTGPTSWSYDPAYCILRQPCYCDDGVRSLYQYLGCSEQSCCRVLASVPVSGLGKGRLKASRSWKA